MYQNKKEKEEERINADIVKLIQYSKLN